MKREVRRGKGGKWVRRRKRKIEGNSKKGRLSWRRRNVKGEENLRYWWGGDKGR